MTRHIATYRSGATVLTTRAYPTREAAWSALGRNLDRHGINPGPWHLPGVVSGDTSRNVAARANGEAGIHEVSA
jgi:hypothetical protein